MSGDVTRVLSAVERGDVNATDELLVLVYQELRRLASQKLAREKPGQTLQATALVHEAFIRLVGDESSGWDSRTHFFAAAAEGMRRILVEAARRKARVKHGGDRERQELQEGDALQLPTSIDLIALDEALDKLAQRDPTMARLVQLRFFTGLTVEDAGKMLGISRATADRRWAYARAWLYKEIGPGD
jgi:RNA polymerase sigma factor (TIGR02999 family)